MAGDPVFRFAPSPNGQMHLGHALSALINYEQARATSGTFLLRIEDIDVGRAREAFVEGIFKDLSWLGLSWPEPVLCQSTRFDAYRAAAEQLINMGLLYPCFASRRDIAEAADPSRRDPDGAPLYPLLHKAMTKEEIERRKNEGQPYALRIDMPKAIAMGQKLSGSKTFTYRTHDGNGDVDDVTADPARWGDAVIVRKDIDASYHLAVVVDDAHQNITHVTRGADLEASTDIHVLLQILLGLDSPLYHHHRLLTDDKGRKLSKSAKDQSLRELREAGRSPPDIRKMTGIN